jgi:hypothetical protein
MQNKNFSNLTNEQIIKLSHEQIEEYAKKEAIQKGVKFVERSVDEPKQPSLRYTGGPDIYRLEIKICSPDKESLDRILEHALPKIRELNIVTTEKRGAYTSPITAYKVVEGKSWDTKWEIEKVVDGHLIMSDDEWNEQFKLIEHYEKQLESFEKQADDRSQYIEIKNKYYDKVYEAIQEHEELIKNVGVFGEYVSVEEDIEKAKKYYKTAYKTSEKGLDRIVDKWEELRKTEDKKTSNSLEKEDK